MSQTRHVRVYRPRCEAGFLSIRMSQEVDAGASEALAPHKVRSTATGALLGWRVLTHRDGAGQRAAGYAATTSRVEKRGNLMTFLGGTRCAVPVPVPWLMLSCVFVGCGYARRPALCSLGRRGRRLLLPRAVAGRPGFVEHGRGSRRVARGGSVHLELHHRIYTAVI